MQESVSVSASASLSSAQKTDCDTDSEHPILHPGQLTALPQEQDDRILSFMRTFIAIPLPVECQSMLEQMQMGLRSSQAEAGWVAIPSIHLTLKFLGEVDPAIVPGLAQALKAVSGNEHPFELRLRGLGCFPSQRNPRVVWCGIDGDLNELSRLQEIVEQTCGKFGFPPEDRAFKPHLTLGRVKGKRNLQALVECIKIGSDLERRFRVDHINIYKSTLKPKGAEYAILNTVVLRD